MFPGFPACTAFQVFLVVAQVMAWQPISEVLMDEGYSLGSDLFLFLLLLVYKTDLLSTQITLPVFRDAWLLGSVSTTNSAFGHLRSPPFLFLWFFLCFLS